MNSSSFEECVQLYLHPLFTATKQTSIRELQGLFSTGTLLSFNLQTAKVAFVDGQRLKSLLWTQVTLMEQLNIDKCQINGKKMKTFNEITLDD